MIVVYRFQTHLCCGCCWDETNVFGHAAASFNRANFAISYYGSPGMGTDNGDPTYTNDVDLQQASSDAGPWKGSRSNKPPSSKPASPPVEWREKLVHRGNANSFKHLISKAYIISNEDLLEYGEDPKLAPGGGVSERLALEWWKQTLTHKNFGSADCADMVFRALIAAGCANVAWYVWKRTPWRPLYTPEAAVALAESVNKAIVSNMKLTDDSVEKIKRADRCWASASGNVSKDVDVALQSARDESRSARDDSKLVLLEDS